MNSTTTLADPVICRCLRVTKSQIVDAVVLYGCETVREVTCTNKAGGGCNACHCRIRELISQARRDAIADQA